jgi:AraC-like DNA-binding protein
MYFLSMVRLDGYLVAPRRNQFSLSFDTYDNWCLLLPRSGSFDFEVGDAHGTARFGDIVVCPPGGTLWRRMRTPTAFFHARFSTDLEPPTARTRLRDLDRLRSDFALLETAQSHTDLVAAHVVTDLILMMLRSRRDAPEDQLVRKATTFLLDNFTAPDLSLGDLAAELGISAAQLSRRFRAVRGVTPVAYLRNIRLQKARELLTETDNTLQTIAEQSGYRSAFYLSRVFSNHTGQSPSSYRRASRV